MSSFEERLAKRLEEPEFAAAWKETELEYLVARNIIKQRKALGLTQNELAKRLKTKQSVISRIESGNSNITLKTVLPNQFTPAVLCLSQKICSYLT